MPCRHRSSLLSAGKPTYPVRVPDDCLGRDCPRAGSVCGNPRLDRRLQMPRRRKPRPSSPFAIWINATSDGDGWESIRGLAYRYHSDGRALCWAATAGRQTTYQCPYQNEANGESTHHRGKSATRTWDLCFTSHNCRDQDALANGSRLTHSDVTPDGIPGFTGRRYRSIDRNRPIRTASLSSYEALQDQRAELGEAGRTSPPNANSTTF